MEIEVKKYRGEVISQEGENEKSSSSEEKHKKIQSLEMELRELNKLLAAEK